jgi:hypothetical protein
VRPFFLQGAWSVLGWADLCPAGFKGLRQRIGPGAALLMGHRLGEPPKDACERIDVLLHPGRLLDVDSRAAETASAQALFGHHQGQTAVKAIKKIK